MSTAYSAASTAAPAPTSIPVHGEHSKEDLATAAVLQTFIQADDRYASSSTSSMRRTSGPDESSAKAGAPPSRPSEVPEYHSLDDTINYQQASRSPQPSPGQSSNSAERISSGTAPITGQVCRYVCSSAFHRITLKLECCAAQKFHMLCYNGSSTIRLHDYNNDQTR
jgi:GATA-binding protein